MNVIALYANSLLWGLLIVAAEARGNKAAQRAIEMFRWDD